MKSTGSIEINRSIDDVFDFTINHVPQWCESVIEDELVEETHDGIGNKLRIVTEENGHRMEFAAEVTIHQPPTRSAIMMYGDMFDIEVDYTFENLGYRTRVTLDSAVTPHGLGLKIMFTLFGWLMKSSGKKSLDRDFARLKQMLESES